MKRKIALLLTLLTLLSLCAPAYASTSVVLGPGQFEDVTPETWCADYVRTAYELGLMRGKSESFFDTEGHMTVAESIAIAARLHKSYYGKQDEFEESVPWYDTYVRYAESNGIIRRGQYEGQYDNEARRVIFATVLGAALPDKALPAISTVAENAIPDIPPQADYYLAVYRLYRAGVLTGSDEKGSFFPDSPIRRGEAAALSGRMADPSLRKVFTLMPAFEPVPLNKLVNLRSLRKNATNAQMQEAYSEAVELVRPYAGMSREEQLYGVTAAIRARFDSGMRYSMTEPHYNDPYGYFVLGVASCAGCVRATGLCLNILGIPYEHVNENQYGHQWCRVKLDGEYWISDAFGLYCGLEPAPYKHPYM